MRRRDIVAAAAGAVVITVLAGSVAWAAIPGEGGIYTACMLKNVGTVRLIDKSLPASNLMSHCKPALEVEIRWNQQGQAGPQGIQGPPGDDGDDGTSPTVVQLAPGDPNCLAGGAAITDTAGSTAYVCSGQDGADGEPFAGTFTSPNGEYSISVANDGIVLSHGSDASILLTGSNVAIASGSGFQLTAGGNVLVTAGGELAAGSGTGTTLQSGNTFSIDSATSISASAGSTVAVQSGSSTTVQASSGLSLVGSQVRLNAGSSCAAAARLGDTVVAGSIASGSSTVCVG